MNAIPSENLHATANEAKPVGQAVILVGGLGSRLGSAVRECPKPLLKIGDRPFLAHLMGFLAGFGLSRFLLLAGYRAEVVAEHFSASPPPAGRELDIIVEDEPLGTGGALRAAAPKLEDRFLMANGDSFYDCDLRALLAPLPGPATLGRLALRPVPDLDRYGQVLTEGRRVTGFNDKAAKAGPGLMNAGLYLFRREIVQGIQPGRVSLEREVLPDLASQGLLESAVFGDSYFIDIGLPEDLERARQELPTLLAKKIGPGPAASPGDQSESKQTTAAKK